MLPEFNDSFAVSPEPCKNPLETKAIVLPPVKYPSNAAAAIFNGVLTVLVTLFAAALSYFIAELSLIILPSRKSLYHDSVILPVTS